MAVLRGASSSPWLGLVKSPGILQVPVHRVETKLMHLSAPARRSIWAGTLLLPLISLAVIWYPEFRHNRAPEASITTEVMEAARHSPSDSVLQEARSFYLFPVENRGPEVENRIAEDLLEGQLAIPDVPPARFHLAFTPTDLDSLPPGPRLWFAAFAVPDFLLAAYQNTGREEFYRAARDFILSWNRYEERAWLPRGLLWNDHATAARVRVLGEFWRRYRHRPDFDPAVARAILGQAARYGEFLRDPGQFTFSTNHGVMQNVGLLHLSLAFPTLPKSALYRETAMERLHEQLGFFIDGEGVVREHSAGYQSFGLEILGIGFRCLTLQGSPIPADWADKYAKGIGFFSRLRRPDATLPANGDTDGAPQTVMPRLTNFDSDNRAGPLHYPADWRPDSETSLHAAAGYWVDWNSLTQWPMARQTVVTWTRRPPPAHKHADDLAVLPWSGGISWLTSVGYWPYGTRGRDQVESWTASNAPHLVGEPTESQRSARVLGSVRSGDLAALDLERVGPGDYRVRRQVLRLDPDIWVIVDHTTGTADQRTETVWTVSPRLMLRPDSAAGSFTLSSDSGRASARIALLGAPGTSIREYRGSYAPFAGWHVEHYDPGPASALVVQQPATAWLAVVLSTSPETDRAGFTRPTRFEPGSGPERWSLSIGSRNSPVTIRREGAELTVLGASRAHPALSATLVPAPDAGPALDSLRQAYLQSANRYPRFQEERSRRTRMTYLLGVLFVGQELLLLSVLRAAPRWHLPLRVASLVSWLAVAVWIHFVFIRTWVVLTH